MSSRTRAIRVVLLILAAPIIGAGFVMQALRRRNGRSHDSIATAAGSILLLALAYSLRAHWGAQPRPLIVEWGFPFLVASGLAWCVLFVMRAGSSRS